ncbi:MAG: MBL fold metallo-hydrolase [Sedimentisphaerales bacterium]|jgi:L-ascorbate metabolism protein UlaG (beta-lactamase superfamily)|nr:MBL fold metallo-hydrolase [Sedimentisphaerales bacterium]HNY77039.1 MBL fold metallo-hydrolase [Sedimentisphaerales bacterium]HOC62546.1 MBL fold metallo-hydrolase [Sedimentisphaerales bacterium]HOH63064.1 MBL fold metallo-hydrolase [Sedimentisphaerales bacterium]HPY51095.1 MBL fold metallo-hydrolase [Sedimentisphaerales bacterium]
MRGLGHFANRSAWFIACLALAVAVGVGGVGEAQEATSDAIAADLNGDDIVGFADFAALAQRWRQETLLTGTIVGFHDLAILAAHWLEETAPIVYIQWLGHASVKVWSEGQIVYVDPQNLSISPHDATLVLVTHSHSDHYSRADISRVSNGDTAFIGPPDVVNAYGGGQALAPGETIVVGPLRITGVWAYNINKTNHPKSNNWLGYVIEIGSKRVYCAGDTDVTEEMKALEDIDVAFLPAGGTYTATAQEAAEATKHLRPRLAIPYHWGQIVGSRSDAERFARFAACNAKAMTEDEILNSRQWGKEYSLLSHWTLDASEGNMAEDVIGSRDGVLRGNPKWRPRAGVFGGALEFDGQSDCVEIPFVVNPSQGPFSVFAWAAGGAPGEVLLSQADQVNWLAADASTGALGTEMRGVGRNGKPLWSQTAIADGNWHRVGLVWDGADRVLYVDGVEVARDAQPGLGGSNDSLYLGAGADLAPDSFWSGRIDDVRIYLRAIAP